MKTEIKMNEKLTLSERATLGMLMLWGMAVILFITAGCASDRVKNVELDGMFTQTESGTLAIGSIELMASPKGEESAIIKYGEDTAWLSPSTKTHEIKIMLNGSNCVDKVDAIVEHICKAFLPTAAVLNGVKVEKPATQAETAGTNTMQKASSETVAVVDSVKQ